MRLLLILLGAWVDYATARQARERRRAAWAEQQRARDTMRSEGERVRAEEQEREALMADVKRFLGICDD